MSATPPTSGTAPTPMPTASISCPACHAPVAAGTKFCPQCGSAVSGAASASAPAKPGSPPVDIRQSVDQDRGFLKRVQLLIPGFRGYRQGEDDRAADSLLRMQVADRVHQALVTIQMYRTQLTQANQFQGLTDLGPVIADLQQLEGSVRHAEQGYTGISPAVRIQTSQLDRLYEYDYGFVSAAATLGVTASGLSNPSSDPAGVASAIETLRSQVRQLDAAFRARIRAIQGIQV
ncbi:MAG: zinc ribbon domain-containing protein [Thermoplasmata archaeon]|nr:zinc ribbon domain-containing protein [Thermoplasmata archaeon]